MEGDSPNDTYEFPERLEFQGLKKKKKVRFVFEDPEPTNPMSEPNEINPPPSEIFDPDTFLNFDLPKKKKKRKKSDLIADSFVETPVDPDDPVLESSPDDASTEYTYEDLLSRVFAIMRERDPNRDVEANKKLVIKPPQVIRIGSKKTSFINFLDLCKQMHRLPCHVQSFLLVELGTSGSIDGNNQLIIKGRFEQKMIENVLRRYIREYVACHTCKSPETLLQKDTRLVFLQCESCGARCSVASIKAGFQAVTGKRAAMRAKSN